MGGTLVFPDYLPFFCFAIGGESRASESLRCYGTRGEDNTKERRSEYKYDEIFSASVITANFILGGYNEHRLVAKIGRRGGKIKKRFTVRNATSLGFSLRSRADCC